MHAPDHARRRLQATGATSGTRAARSRTWFAGRMSTSTAMPAPTATNRQRRRPVQRPREEQRPDREPGREDGVARGLVIDRRERGVDEQQAGAEESGNSSEDQCGRTPGDDRSRVQAPRRRRRGARGRRGPAESRPRAASGACERAGARRAEAPSRRAAGSRRGSPTCRAPSPSASRATRSSRRRTPPRRASRPPVSSGTNARSRSHALLIVGHSPGEPSRHRRRSSPATRCSSSSTFAPNARPRSASWSAEYSAANDVASTSVGGPDAADRSSVGRPRRIRACAIGRGAWCRRRASLVRPRAAARRRRRRAARRTRRERLPGTHGRPRPCGPRFPSRHSARVRRTGSRTSSCSARATAPGSGGSRSGTSREAGTRPSPNAS